MSAELPASPEAELLRPWFWGGAGWAGVTCAGTESNHTA